MPDSLSSSLAPSLGSLSGSLRPARADDYTEPLAGMIRRGEIEPPDELVIEDRTAPSLGSLTPKASPNPRATT